jgi:hypothetical protein
VLASAKSGGVANELAAKDGGKIELAAKDGGKVEFATAVETTGKKDGGAPLRASF